MEIHGGLKFGSFGLNSREGGVTWNWDVGNQKEVYRVPKRDLIVGLQVLMQQGGLQIAEGMKEGATLVKEMAEMRVKISGSGNEQFGAWRSGEHDDLVLAVALACWGVKKVTPRVRRRQVWLV